MVEYLSQLTFADIAAVLMVFNFYFSDKDDTRAPGYAVLAAYFAWLADVGPLG